MSVPLHTSPSMCSPLLTTSPHPLSPHGDITAEWVCEDLPSGSWHSDLGLATGACITLDKLLNLTAVSFSPLNLWDYKSADLNRW